jgi:hypothetical protein
MAKCLPHFYLVFVENLVIKYILLSMQDRPERLARCSETKSGGGISTMTSMIVDTNFELVTTRVGSHRG